MAGLTACPARGPGQSAKILLVGNTRNLVYSSVDLTNGVGTNVTVDTVLNIDIDIDTDVDRLVLQVSPRVWGSAGFLANSTRGFAFYPGNSALSSITFFLKIS